MTFLSLIDRIDNLLIIFAPLSNTPGLNSITSLHYRIAIVCVVSFTMIKLLS